MKFHVREFALTAILAATAAGAPAQETGDPFANLDFQQPECVRAAPGDAYLVSNVNGDFTERDGNGFITRIPSGGEGEAELRWIAGGEDGTTLNAPKGMAFWKGQLHVADIDHVRNFAADTGEPQGSVPIPGAEFLNDIAVGEDGTLYVTDTGTKDTPGGIWRVTQEGEITNIASGREKELHRPNGIAMTPSGDLRVVTFGGETVFTISTEGEVLERRELGEGRLDGIVVDDDGSTFVSSWKAGEILRLGDDGSAETVMSGLTQPACFGYDARTGRLMVPEVEANRVTVGEVRG